MISEKMKELVATNSVIRMMFEEGKRLSNIYGKENVYDFSLGNPSVPAPDEIRKTAIEVLENLDPITLHSYTSNAGFEDVRMALANKSNELYNTNYNANNFVLTSGAAAAINIVLKSIINPEDEVIVFAPFFSEYKAYVTNYDGKLVVISPNTETFQPNLQELKNKITNKTKAVIINTPNNPTGVIYSEETLKELGAILEEAQNKHGNEICLISDEPYRELFYGDFKIPYVPNYYKNTFVAYSYSKSLSLPGERIGYVVIPNEVSDFETVLTAITISNRISGFVNASTLWQKVIAKSLDLSVDTNIYKKNRDALLEILEEAGIECIKPDGAFYLFPKALIEDDKKFCEIAKELRLLIVPGSGFGCPGYFRISYCVPYETIVNSKESFLKLKDMCRGV